MGSRLLFTVSALLIAVLGAAPSAMADFKLDSAFGTGGMTLFNPAPNAYNTVVSDGLVQPDGKVVVTGVAYQDGASSDGAVFIARLTAGGQLDPDFGTGGVTTTNFADGPDDAGNGVALGAGNSLYVAGSTGNSGLLLRYTSSGLPDVNFGSGGAVKLAAARRADAVAVQPADGKPVVVGLSAAFDFVAARFDTLGNPDAQFNGTGSISTSLSSGIDEARDVVVQPDSGRIVAGGVADAGGVGSDFALVGYTSSGSLDANFGSGGKSIMPGPDRESGSALALGPGSTLAMAGEDFKVTQNSFERHFQVIRYDAAGNPDPSFGSGGVVIPGFTFDGIQDTTATAKGVVIGKLPAGVPGAGETRIAVGGTVFKVNSGDDLGLVLLKPDGSIDPNFPQTTFPNPGQDEVAALASVDKGDGVLGGQIAGIMTHDNAPGDVAQIDAIALNTAGDPGSGGTGGTTGDVPPDGTTEQLICPDAKAAGYCVVNPSRGIGCFGPFAAGKNSPFLKPLDVLTRPDAGLTGEAIVTPRAVARGGVFTIDLGCTAKIDLRKVTVDVVLIGPGKLHHVIHIAVTKLGKAMLQARVPAGTCPAGLRAHAAKKCPFGKWLMKLFAKKKKKKTTFTSAKPVAIAPPPTPAQPTGARCSGTPPSTFLIYPNHVAPGATTSLLLWCGLKPLTNGFQGAFTPGMILIYDEQSFRNSKYVGGRLVPISPSFPVRPPLMIVPGVPGPVGSGASVIGDMDVDVTLPSNMQTGRYVVVILDAQGEVASENLLNVP